MIQIRKSKERGHFDHGWLNTYHTFSFSDYYDPNFMGFKSLRVINEDIVAKGEGFPTHGHKNMEIVTYILSGALEHKDSTGSQGVIRPGEVQKMSAGRGIRHSEYNHLKDQDTHLLQIWIEPDQDGLPPGYIQKDFSDALNTGAATLLCSKTARDGSILIYQDAEIWAKRYLKTDSWEFRLEPKRSAWIQVAKGSVTLNSTPLSQGDGAAVQGESIFTLKADAGAEVIVFNLL